MVEILPISLSTCVMTDKFSSQSFHTPIYEMGFVIISYKHVVKLT